MVVENVEMLSQKTQRVDKLPHMTAFMTNIKYFTHYSNEILDSFYEAERNNIIIRKRSDQMHIRPELVEMMKKFAKEHEYTPATLFLGEFKFCFTLKLFTLFLL